MDKHPFGSTQRLVPVVGQGTWYIDDADHVVAIAALTRGLNLGMTHIDTAEMYGDAEEVGFPGPHTPGGGVLAEIAAPGVATPRQVALAFLTRRDSLLTIPKSADPAHTEENAGGGELRLSPGEIDPRPSRSARAARCR